MKEAEKELLDLLWHEHVNNGGSHWGVLGHQGKLSKGEKAFSLAQFMKVAQTEMLSLYKVATAMDVSSARLVAHTDCWI